MSSFSEDKNVIRTKEILILLSTWDISAQEQITLLGLSGLIKARHLKQYREDKAFPQSEEINERLDHLFGIAEALRTSYPHNELMGAIWLSTPHRRFRNIAPIQIMIEQGLPGLISVRAHLDCAFDWLLDAKRHATKRQF